MRDGWDKYENNEPLPNEDTFVYSMARCGTSSIVATLMDAGLPHINAHWIQYKRTKEMDSKSPAEHATPHFSFTKMIKNGTSPALKVIVPLREPVARNIAAYFRVMLRKSVLGPALNQTDVSTLQQMLIKNYYIYYPDDWFKYELMDIFNFNPFKLKFDHEAGYSIYEVGKHKILFIRLEDYDKSLSKALYELLGIEGLEPQHINQFSGEKYKEFKSTPLPREWVEKNYEMKYAQHFWTDEEREELTRKWTI